MISGAAFGRAREAWLLKLSSGDLQQAGGAQCSCAGSATPTLGKAREHQPKMFGFLQVRRHLPK
jgi:hypothetical protein